MSLNTARWLAAGSSLAAWVERLKKPHMLPGRIVRRLLQGSQPSAFPRPGRRPGRSFSERFRDVPAWLARKVNGTTQESVFRTAGQLTAQTLLAHLDLAAARRVLDFGCGLGRTLLALQTLAPGPVYVAYDIDPLMLEWCRYLLGDDRALEYTGSSLALPDGRHDVIYAISVFTHLDESADYWLAEIHRLLTSKGRAFLTFHDETLFDELRGTPALPGTTCQSTLQSVHVEGAGSPEGGARMGVFYTTRRWEEKLARFFHIERTVPRGLFGHQSFSLVRSKPARPDWSELRKQYARVLERELFELRKVQGHQF